MKYGHAEPHLRGSNPSTWRWRLREAMWDQPDVILYIGGGVVLLICTVAVIFWWVEHDRDGRPPTV